MKTLPDITGMDSYIMHAHETLQMVFLFSVKETFNSFSSIATKRYELSDVYIITAACINCSEPDMWNVIKIVIPKVKASWEDVAYSMGYDVYFVKATREGFNSLEKRCRQVFTDWLMTSHGPAPKTWHTLLSKLKDVDDLTAAVESIEKELTELDI